MIQQLTVKLPNRPGSLERALAALAAANVDLRALAVSDRGPDHGEASMIVSDLDSARTALTDYELLVHEVVVVAVDDRVGGLAAILEVLAAREVNIAQLYAFVSRHQTKALAVLRVDGDPADAARLLADAGFSVIGGVAGADARPTGPKPLDEHSGLDFIW
ncbi:MAG: ACT domain-containing protein [Planctomycetota bacterium]|nr:MAG: ACT domain-containing protein [Planctomycetota bacterium]